MQLPLSLALALLPLATSACIKTSLPDTERKTPVLVADSARDLKAISTCVTEAWIATGATPRMVERSDGISLVYEAATTYNIVFALLDLKPTTAGTHADLRIFKTVWAKQNRKRVDAVRACL